MFDIELEHTSTDPDHGKFTTASVITAAWEKYNYQIPEPAELLYIVANLRNASESNKLKINVEDIFGQTLVSVTKLLVGPDDILPNNAPQWQTHGQVLNPISGSATFTLDIPGRHVVMYKINA